MKIRRYGLIHEAFSNALFGTYVTAASFSNIKTVWEEEVASKRLNASDTLFLCCDCAIEKTKQEQLLKELASIYSHIYMLPCIGGEESKTYTFLSHLIEYAQSINARPTWHIAALGGGALIDAVSFFSSIYLRGISFLAFPSTLLSMTDAAIGGKNGINWNGVKNIIGTISYPKIVYSAVHLLCDIPKEHLLMSFAEMWKHSLLSSKERSQQFRSFFEKYIVHQQTLVSCIDAWIEEIAFHSDFKMNCVTQSVANPDVRHALNLGHTVAHALEAATNGKMAHGVAVLYGITSESMFGKHIGYVQKDVAEDIEFFFHEMVPYYVKWTQKLDKNRFFQAISYDKKNVSSWPSLVLLATYGSCFYNEENRSICFELKQKEQLQQLFKCVEKLIASP